MIVSLVYTYPKWRDYRRADVNLKKNWDRFLGYLKRHERKHGEIAMNTAKQYERAFKRGRGSVAKKCEDWTTSVDRKIKPLIARYHRKQAQFDKREHGRFGRVRRAQIALISGR